jgi:hypothetical protein
MSRSSTTQIDLKQELRRISPDLSERLDGVRKAVNKVWKVPYLHWYTDHGPRHSRRVVGLIGQILRPLCLDYLSRRENDFPLSDYELYILLAACYLHDIGMQDLKVNERSVDELGPGDWEEIRKRHPQRSFEIIRDRTVKPRHRRTIDLGLDESDEDDSLMPIALVSMAHGSEYFESAISKLQENLYRPGGKPIHGDLLAALLMMGDEIDLHKSRAKLPDDSRRYPPLSLLHHYKHHYISSVAVQDGKSRLDRQIIVGFLFPPQAQGSYDGDLKAWVVNKIEEQANRTQDILLSATEGQLRWDERKPVVAKIRYDEYGEREALPPQVQEVLREQLQKPKPSEKEKEKNFTHPPFEASLEVGEKGVEPKEEYASLWLLKGVELIDWIHLDKPVTLIGRAPECDLRLGRVYYRVSRKHARVEKRGLAYVLLDGDGVVKSEFGTHVNSEEIDCDSGRQLRDGDLVILGGIKEDGEGVKDGACILLFRTMSNDQWEEITKLLGALQTHRSNLAKLEVTKAKYGMAPPLQIVNEIDDAKKEIARLTRTLTNRVMPTFSNQ